MSEKNKKFQWFKFYPKDFMDDEEVKSMDYEAIGLYWVMLCHCWTNDSMPSDHKKLQRIFKVSSHKFKKLWIQINEKFFEKDSRYFNKRILEEKNNLEKDFRKKSDSGSKGADSRWHRHKDEYGDAIGDAIISPMQDTDTDIDTEIDTESLSLSKENMTNQDLPSRDEKKPVDPNFKSKPDLTQQVKDALEISDLATTRYKNTQFSHEVHPWIVNLLASIAFKDLKSAILIVSDNFENSDTEHKYRPNFNKMFQSASVIAEILKRPPQALNSSDREDQEMTEMLEDIAKKKRGEQK